MTENSNPPEKKPVVFSRSRKILHITLAAGLIIFGASLSLIPFVPGIVFGTMGTILLARHVPFIQRCIVRLNGRYPRLGGMILKAEAKLDKLLLRVFPIKKDDSDTNCHDKSDG